MKSTLNVLGETFILMGCCWFILIGTHFPIWSALYVSLLICVGYYMKKVTKSW